jgi:TrmH family RNA methyltransferase
MLPDQRLSQKKLKQIKKLHQKKYRKLSNLFISEGYRLFDTAIKNSKNKIYDLLLHDRLYETERGKAALKKARTHQIDIYIMDDRQLKLLSDEVNPSGIIFTAEIQNHSLENLVDTNQKIIIYLDRLSEPGNLGTIIRSAAAFGVSDIILSPDCADPFNEKSVRASAGAIFNVKIYNDISLQLLKKQFRVKGYKYVATVAQDGVPLHQWQMDSNCIIFFGQEASGLSKEIINSADLRISIPQKTSVESLNVSVAAAIILYEASKR